MQSTATAYGKPSFYKSCFLKKKKEKKPPRGDFSAEAGGFEPPVQLPVRQFSKLVVSATHPHFQCGYLNEIGCKYTSLFSTCQRKMNIFTRNFIHLRVVL